MKKISITYMISDGDFDAFAKGHAIFNRCPDGSVVVGFEMHDDEEISEQEMDALNPPVIP